jgi:ketosteroid isomerase-like protein
MDGDMIDQSAPERVIERLQAAIDSHDLDAMANCFAEDFTGEFPAHHGRDMRGREQMKRNWAQILGGVPNLRATAANGKVVFAEWAWDGRFKDGKTYAMRGTTVQEVRDDQIVWSRLYMEPMNP